jgi:hypothetical protein
MDCSLIEMCVGVSASCMVGPEVLGILAISLRSDYSLQ